MLLVFLEQSLCVEDAFSSLLRANATYILLSCCNKNLIIPKTEAKGLEQHLVHKYSINVSHFIIHALYKCFYLSEMYFPQHIYTWQNSIPSFHF